MNTKTLSIAFLLTALLTGSGVAANISPAMLAQFKQLPAAQQQALAAQYGVDINSLNAQSADGLEQASSAQPTLEPRDVDVSKLSQRANYVDKNLLDTDLKNKLQPFGYNIFAGQPTSQTPIGDIPVPDDYVVGPGDQIKIQLFGKENASYTLKVGREGNIDFPKLGPINVAGLTFQEVKDDLQERITKQFIGVESSISFGTLRTMQIFVMGDAYKPGAYNVNALTTVTQALLIAGGIDTVGSLRNIQVKRGNEIIQHIDLYNMLLSGDTSQDIRLTSGDTIFIAAKGKEVSVDGLVKRPAIYELASNTSVREVLALAGGVKAEALREITLTRPTQKGNKVFNLDINAAFKVNDGDKITVNAASSENPTAISLTGAVIREGDFSYQPGMRISSVLQNQSRDLKLTADMNYALVVREVNTQHDIEVLQFSPAKVFARPYDIEDLVLQPKDKIIIFNSEVDLNKSNLKMNNNDDAELSQQLAQKETLLQKSQQGVVDAQTGAVVTSDIQQENRNKLTLDKSSQQTAGDALLADERQQLLKPIIDKLKAQATNNQPVQIAEIRGEVKYAGVYPINRHSRVEDLIVAAGGLQESAYVAELSHVSKLDKNIDITHQRIDIDLAINPNASPLLASKDTINILAHPDWREEATVQVFGEVKYPGTYKMKRGEGLYNLIQRVGGLTDYANPKGTIFAREELRKQEEQRLTYLRTQLKQEISTLALRRQNTSAVQPAEAVGLVDQMESTQAIGRLSINMPAILDGDKQADILLEDGDKLYIPSLQNAVSIIGQVQYPSSQAFDAALSIDDYIDRAGGAKKQADTARTYVIKADGSVMLPSGNYWFSRKSRNLEPGDTIVIPVDTDYLDALSTWSTATQMMYQLGVAWKAIQ